MPETVLDIFGITTTQDPYATEPQPWETEPQPYATEPAYEPTVLDVFGITQPPEFDPEGGGYDYRTAIDSGIWSDETGHWPSREIQSGQILKGQQHESYPSTLQGEREAGYEIQPGEDGRYYSQPSEMEQPYTPPATEFRPGGGYGGAEESEIGFALSAGQDPDDTSTLGGVATAFGRGIAVGLTTDLPEMIGKGFQYATERGQKEKEKILKGQISEEAYARLVAEGELENPGKRLAEWAERKRLEWFGPEPEDQSTVEKMVYEGTRMLAPSVIPGGAVAVGMRVASGVAKTVKAAKAAAAAGDMVRAAALMREAEVAARASATVASASNAALFGSSAAQETKDTALRRAEKLEKAGKHAEAAEMRRAAEGYAPLLVGGIEAAGEYFGTKYLGKLFRLDQAEIVKRGAGKIIKDWFKTLGVEVTTEFGQQYGQASVEKYTAIRPEAEPLAEALQVIGPTIVMTMLTGTGAGIVNMRGKEAAEAEAPKEEKKGYKVEGPVEPLPEAKVTVGEEYGGMPTTGTQFGLTEKSKVVEEGKTAAETPTVSEEQQTKAVDIVDKMYGDLNQAEVKYVFDKTPEGPVKEELRRRMEAGEKPMGPVVAEAKAEKEPEPAKVEVKLPEGQGGEIEKMSTQMRQYDPNFDQTKVIEPQTDEHQEIIHRVADAVLGSKVSFYLSRADNVASRINGYYAREDNRIYINSQAKAPDLFVLGHEAWHEMETKHPDLWNKAMDVIREEWTNFDDYMAEVNKDRLAVKLPELERADIEREFGSDIAGQAFQRPTFWRKLHLMQPEVFDKLADIFRRLVKRIKAALKDDKASRAMVAHMDRIEKVIAEVYSESIKRKGKKVTESKAAVSAEALAKMPRAGKVKVTAIHAETGQKIKVDADAKQAINELEGRIENYYSVLECINAGA